MVIESGNELKSPPLDIPLPWQRSQWQRLVDGFERDLMPHAQIFCGNQGLGKGQFAAALGLYIFCSSRRNGQGCGECRNCRLIRLETHPDFLEIRPEKPSSPIKIDNIRALNDFVNRTSESGVAKIVLIERADQMNRSAANALLKNLEEPPAGTFFFLVTSREMQLPVTIRSRCQLTRFSVPDRGAALEWLGQQTSDIDSCELPILLAAGAPLVALKLSSEEYQRRYNQLFSTLDKLMMGYSNPVTEVKLLLDVDLTELLGWFSGWVGSLIRAQNSSCVDIVETGYEGLEQLTDKLGLTELLKFQNLIQRAFNDSLAASNINKQLILENVLLSWQQAVGGIKRDN
ncbi:MAG: DNA polymerase III subunit delta' [Pseudomonadales bacterium]|nr:DNA polymerase III subunit delta' [Pseudomonadales bacterium]